MIGNAILVIIEVLSLGLALFMTGVLLIFGFRDREWIPFGCGMMIALTICGFVLSVMGI